MKLTEFLKKVCPLNVLFRLKYALFFLRQKEIKTVADKHIYYLDAPDYGNLGDQAIALGIKKFADKYFSDYGFVEISYNELAQYISSLKRTIKPDDIIFLTGGGNMGNIYRIYEASRRFVIKNFPDNKIVVFPQTIDYTDDFFGRCSVKASQRIYSSHKNLILCAREKYSYDIMNRLYVKNSKICCADIVLILEKLNSELKRNNIGICLRNDNERILTDKEHKDIFEALKKTGRTGKSLTTASDKENINHNNRREIISDKLKEFASYELVITDRLHGMIFCVLTKTPCIVFENSNKKISGVYEWIKKIPNIRLLHNTDDILSQITDLLENNTMNEAEDQYNHYEVANAIGRIEK